MMKKQTNNKSEHSIEWNEERRSNREVMTHDYVLNLTSIQLNRPYPTNLKVKDITS